MRYIRSDHILVEALGQIWVAFSPASGETALLNDESASILEVLDAGPAETAEVCATLAIDSGLDANALAKIVEAAWPRLIDAVRLSLGAAWLFLIAAEAIASTEGLGYRIFLVRRYLSMDVILPYVAWITLLAFATDYALRLLSRWAFPWYRVAR